MSNLVGVSKSIQQIMWQDTGLNGDAQRIEQLGWMLLNAGKSGYLTGINGPQSLNTKQK